jgi:hypothetical protein
MILHLNRPLPVQAASAEWTAIQWLLFELDMAGLRLAQSSGWELRT